MSGRTAALILLLELDGLEHTLPLMQSVDDVDAGGIVAGALTTYFTMNRGKLELESESERNLFEMLVPFLDSDKANTRAYALSGMMELLHWSATATPEERTLNREIVDIVNEQNRIEKDPRVKPFLDQYVKSLASGNLPFPETTPAQPSK